MGSGCSSTMSTTQTHSKDQMQGGDGLRYSPAMGKGHDMSLTKAHGEDGQIGEYPGKRSTHGQSHMHYPANLTAMDDDTESCSLITLCDEDEVFNILAYYLVLLRAYFSPLTTTFSLHYITNFSLLGI